MNSMTSVSANQGLFDFLVLHEVEDADSVSQGNGVKVGHVFDYSSTAEAFARLSFFRHACPHTRMLC